ncbi:MAG: hypothetical protein KBT33_07315 [Prevotellaceae bacterium]|nr:hypothetical protein [Candidatus Minthosoma equi]
MHLPLSFLFMLIPLIASAQHWHVEAEDPSSAVTWKGETADIYSPKGLSLWCNELMEGNVIIEYEARIISDKRFRNEQGNTRVSDLNCFWMADKCGGCGGRFVDNYALQTYYLGYGGNWNTTTRFRRYNGDAKGVESADFRPRILKEYTDKEHLLVPNKWYNIRLEQVDGRARYYIDGECLVDYVDPQPLTQGYFAFRTTMAHAQLRNFKYECSNPDAEPILVRNISGSRNKRKGVVTFGVPFNQGEKYDDGFTIKGTDQVIYAHSTWRLASWHDGSAKWQAFCVPVKENCDTLLIYKQKGLKLKYIRKPEPDEFPPFYLTVNNKVQPVLSCSEESADDVRKVKKYTGKNFIIRTYNCFGMKKMVHTLLVDSALNKEGLHELSIHFKVPMHGPEYERYVKFFDNKEMSVQPLVARRNIDLKANDAITQDMIRNIAKWDGFRLSQLSANGYSVRKRATSGSPWIGTYEGTRHNGQVTVGDSTSSISFRLKDFWESHPSTLQVDNARSDTAIVTISLYSPEAEPYRFEHYDTIAHTLEAAYEDVQPGLSTAWGIGRTSTIFIGNGENNKDGEMNELTFCCTPEYQHRKRAFGIWSLPTVENERDSIIESTLDGIMSFYEKEIERNAWYGFFNYGDVMHAYDRSRDEWRYDVGGFAWDNTELGTPAMLWYQFLRTGDPKVWRMAEAMTRHCSEVDTYHIGPHAGLGSRHNVTHWGCGAKESRISEAWWNRFYYYLTADERIGDIMHDVTDSDTLLYTLDPMRLAQPRDQYPCSAPARLRIGPDWLGYASNWFTEWERTLNPNDNSNPYLQKLQNGMTSIANLPHGFFQGPLALGYDPATGIISTETPDELSTNHLMPIMGGFELLNEMEMSISNKPFYNAWLIHNKEYKQKALEIRKNKFSIPRLAAYAGWRLGDDKLKQQAWNDLFFNPPLSERKSTIWTNDCATWTLDAIFMKETINK